LQSRNCQAVQSAQSFLTAVKAQRDVYTQLKSLAVACTASFKILGAFGILILGTRVQLIYQHRTTSKQPFDVSLAYIRLPFTYFALEFHVDVAVDSRK